MLPKSIQYNSIFQTVKNGEEWILPERENWKNSPIFSLEKGSWCSIEISKNNDWLILFYKHSNGNSPIYYKSFEKIQNYKWNYEFKNFTEVIKDSNGMWVKKINNY